MYKMWGGLEILANTPVVSDKVRTIYNNIVAARLNAGQPYAAKSQPPIIELLFTIHEIVAFGVIQIWGSNVIVTVVLPRQKSSIIHS